MTDQQQALTGSYLRERVERLARIKASGERRVGSHQLTLAASKLSQGDLRGLERPRLWAHENRLEGHIGTGECPTGQVCLALTALCEATLWIGTRSVRLCVSVT